MGRRAATIGLVGAALLAVAVRALGLEKVFVADGAVVFALGDAWYHARRAFYAFQDFPRVLWFDPLLNHPDGAWVPWPPFYDLLLAGSARTFGSSREVFERVAAWMPAVLGALTVLPVYEAGRRVGGRGVGVGAALLFALWPATAVYSAVGNADHHAAQALAGATLLALSLAVVSPATRTPGLVAGFAGLALARTALLGIWPGSIVYLALGDGLLLWAAVATGRRGLLLGEAASTLATALAIWPVVRVSGTPVGGPFSAIELSRLHVGTLVGFAVVAIVCLVLDRLRPAGSVLARTLRGGAVAAVVVLALLLATGALRELALGLDYVAKTDAYAGRNLEQYPLFRLEGGLSDALGREMLGFFAWLVPLAPLAALWRARDPQARAPALVLAGWTAGLGALALYQVRFANDWAPAGAAASALGLVLLARAAVGAERPRLAAGLATALALGLLLPVLELHLRAAAATVQAWRLRVPVDRALATHEGTMLRFAQAVAEATPESGGFDDASVRPDYGILSYPGIGHVLHYAARRATPADNFGPYIGREHFEAVGAFFRLEDEAAALAEAERLRTRYVVTTDYGGPVPTTLVNRLHRHDGSLRSEAPALERFRLVTEGPSGGRPVGELFGRGVRAEGAPYKLFEIVPGAVLEAAAPPGTPVSAELRVESPLPRAFVWRTEGVAGADGVARLRVPYATQTRLPVRPRQPYRVQVGEEAFAVTVPEEAVLGGKRIAVGGRAS